MIRRTTLLTLLAITTSFSDIEQQLEKEPWVLHDFGEDQDRGGWRIQNDSVMGGLSLGQFKVEPEGYGVFWGDVSLENNGGFSSVQYFFDPINISEYETAYIRLKGDGKKYNFIVEAKRSDRHYYEIVVETGTEWETIEIPLEDLVPVRRGDRLNKPNFPGETLCQVRFLIGNGKAESFRLEVGKIWLE